MSVLTTRRGVGAGVVGGGGVGANLSLRNAHYNNTYVLCMSSQHYSLKIMVHAEAVCSREALLCICSRCNLRDYTQCVAYEKAKYKQF